MAKQVNVRLDNSQIKTLELLGGNKKGISYLIDKYESTITPEGAINPEEAFFKSIYLPVDKNMRSTYIAYLNTYIKKGVRSEGIGYSMNTIIGNTGFDDKTIRKHFRKLVSVGFIKSVDGSMFRPTLRILDNIPPSLFSQVLEDYTAFIRGKEDYTDFLGDEDES